MDSSTTTISRNGHHPEPASKPPKEEQAQEAPALIEPMSHHSAKVMYQIGLMKDEQADYTGGREDQFKMMGKAILVLAGVLFVTVAFLGLAHMNG